MGRVNAIAYNSNAVLAGSRLGVPVGSHHGHGAGARQVAGVSEWAEEPPAKEPNFGCSATAKTGSPCKARPVTDTDLCVGHTKQAAI